MSKDQVSRERVSYEYMVVATSRFTIEPIDESYELHKIETYNPGWGIQLLLVFRRPWTEVEDAHKRNFGEKDNLTKRQEL